MAILLSEIIRWRSIQSCRTFFFFFWIKLTKTINFLLVLLFHIKEAENDQQGQIGNGDEHANVEEGM